MISTSSFFTYKGDNGVAISRTVPKGWIGKWYLPLAPTWEILSMWKDGKLEEEDYMHLYRRDVLSKLDREKVIKDIGEDAVLLCWETTGFCHRQIARDWLNGELDEV